MRHLLYISLAVLYLLHNDLFLCDDSCLIYGFPSGLLYHIVYCFAVAVLMFLLIRYAWPENLEAESDLKR